MQELQLPCAAIVDSGKKSLHAVVKVDARDYNEYSDSVKSGSVISASPDSGTELHWGDSVKLTVSKGPETADVPNLVGKSKSDAIKTLESLGFEVKTGGLNILGLVQQQSATGKTRLRDTNGNKTVITLTVV